MEERRVLQAKVSSEMPVGLYVIVQSLCCIGDPGIQLKPSRRKGLSVPSRCLRLKKKASVFFLKLSQQWMLDGGGCFLE